ncbi:MAG: hypothetical protein R6U27_11320 [Desulfobacterales bacterium]
MCFFDLTNTYFESQANANPKANRGRSTVIIDAGIATAQNISYLKANHFHYIVVNRGKGDFSATDVESMQLIRQNKY